MAELFVAAKGARVVVTDLVDDAGNAAVAAVRDAGGQAIYVRADVAKWDDCVAMVAAATETFGGLHILYNNAGIFPADDGGALDTPEATWERVMAVNLKGVWLGCKAGIPALLASGGGAIVNVASFVALMGAATAQIAYTSSKGGVLAIDVRNRGRVRAGRASAPTRRAPARSKRSCWKSCCRIRRAPARRMVHIPMGRLGRARGAGEGRSVSRIRRRIVHDRRVARRRRRHHRRLRHP